MLIDLSDELTICTAYFQRISLFLKSNTRVNRLETQNPCRNAGARSLNEMSVKAGALVGSLSADNVGRLIS